MPTEPADANQSGAIGASSQTPQTEATKEIPQVPPPPGPAESIPERISWWATWKPVFSRFVARSAAVFGALVSFLWFLALWDSYRPKITVSPGGTLNSKYPFATIFIVQNQGALPIENIRYLTRWNVPETPYLTNQSKLTFTEQNVTVIPQMKSLESYSLSMHYGPAQTNATTNPAEIKQVLIPGIILLWFEISYEPKYFGKRIDTFHFTGLTDVDGNWQWFPSAHQSINDQTIDTNLLPPPPIRVSPDIRLTNGDIKAHTN